MDDITHEQLLLLIAGIAAIITAVSPIIATFGASLGSRYTAMRAARKEDVEAVKNEIAQLNKRIDQLEIDKAQLQQSNIELREYISLLRVALIENSIIVPPMETGK